jgi:hypothetical protein
LEAGAQGRNRPIKLGQVSSGSYFYLIVDLQSDLHAVASSQLSTVFISTRLGFVVNGGTCSKCSHCVLRSTSHILSKSLLRSFIFSTHLPHRQKQRASTYYPAKLTGVYQTAQNITNSHLMQLCQCVPDDIRHDLRLLQSKKSGTGGGRSYWTKAAGGCGIEEVDGGGLKLKTSQERGEPDGVKLECDPQDKALKTDS